MKQLVQVKVNEEEFNQKHEQHLQSAIEHLHEVAPRDSRMEGLIIGERGRYEGRLFIRSRIGVYVARAKSRNLFSLIAKLKSRVLGQVLNWREKQIAKNRYQRRKRNISIVVRDEST